MALRYSFHFWFVLYIYWSEDYQSLAICFNCYFSINCVFSWLKFELTNHSSFSTVTELLRAMDARTTKFIYIVALVCFGLVFRSRTHILGIFMLPLHMQMCFLLLPALEKVEITSRKKSSWLFNETRPLYLEIKTFNKTIHNNFQLLFNLLRISRCWSCP